MGQCLSDADRALARTASQRAAEGVHRGPRAHLQGLVRRLREALFAAAAAAAADAPAPGGVGLVLELREGTASRQGETEFAQRCGGIK